jgi:hypothetical protein
MDLSVRELQLSDIPLLVDYWLGSSEEHLLALSEGLEYNLLSLYLPLLPERLRETDETRTLREQME